MRFVGMGWYGLVPRVQEQCLLIFPVLADLGAHMLAALFLRMQIAETKSSSVQGSAVV